MPGTNERRARPRSCATIRDGGPRHHHLLVPLSDVVLGRVRGTRGVTTSRRGVAHVVGLENDLVYFQSAPLPTPARIRYYVLFCTPPRGVPSMFREVHSSHTHTSFIHDFRPLARPAPPGLVRNASLTHSSMLKLRCTSLPVSPLMPLRTGASPAAALASVSARLSCARARTHGCSDGHASRQSYAAIVEGGGPHPSPHLGHERPREGGQPARVCCHQCHDHNPAESPRKRPPRRLRCRRQQLLSCGRQQMRLRPLQWKRPPAHAPFWLPPSPHAWRLPSEQIRLHRRPHLDGRSWPSL